MQSLLQTREYVLMNPLPKITWRQLYELADLRPPIKRQSHLDDEVFNLDVDFGGVSDGTTRREQPAEQITLKPEGSFGPLSKNEVAELYSDKLKSLGAVAIKESDSKARKKQAVLNALQIAQKHYQIFGRTQLESIMAKRSHRQEDVEQFKDTIYHNFLVNKAREDVITDHIDKLARGA